MPRSRKSRAIPLLTLWAFMACYGRTFTLPLLLLTFVRKYAVLFVYGFPKWNISQILLRNVNKNVTYVCVRICLSADPVTRWSRVLRNCNSLFVRKFPTLREDISKQPSSSSCWIQNALIIFLQLPEAPVEHSLPTTAEKILHKS